uniref:Uncharacterized protein n=1 Tax=Chaetoceros debilis TaxID=122233 RepID=A0A7S3QDP8_9STRA
MVGWRARIEMYGFVYTDDYIIPNEYTCTTNRHKGNECKNQIPVDVQDKDEGTRVYDPVYIYYRIACWYSLIHSSRLNHNMRIFFPRVDVIYMSGDNPHVHCCCGEENNK